VLALTVGRPDLARTLGATPVLAAEVVHAVRREMAVTLGDVVFRRTDLCTAGHPGEEALVEAARLMAEASGWSAARRVAELDEIRRRLNLARSGRSFLDADAPGDPALVA
jgi:glycerol-3-phosphate dehydrogenase